MAVKVNMKASKHLKKQLQVYQRSSVKVGIIGSLAGASLVAIAVYNEFGTRRGIPPRPFMRLTFKNKSRKMITSINDGYNKVLNGGDAYKAVTQVGLVYKGFIQQTINSNIPPANNTSTIAQKGSSKTLIDTGRLIGSVDFEIQ